MVHGYVISDPLLIMCVVCVCLLLLHGRLVGLSSDFRQDVLYSVLKLFSSQKFREIYESLTPYDERGHSNL
jgi:hypothetical protein